MAERQKYEQWLRDLDEKKDSTPEKVFERVRADYTERLQEVMTNLRQHTATLQEHARGLMIRLKELEVSEEELVEEQSENELRSQVGELSSSEWELGKKKADKLLVKFKEDQTQIADDLNQIREILADAHGIEADTPPAGVPRHSTDFDELEFLKSVVGAQSNTPPKAKFGGPAPAQPRAAEPVAAQPVAAPPEPPPPKAPLESLVEQPKPTEQLTGKAGTAQGSGMQVVTDGQAAIRSSKVTDTPKTLKCAECGAMNYSSEWYCERCGAELANI